jgi:transcription factor C subunit 7
VDPATGTYSASIRSPTGIPTDPPLTSYGVEQANELADHLLKFDPPIDLVYSSPYYRCLQTINPFVAKRNHTTSSAGDSPNVSSSKQHEIRVEGGVSEWFGSAPWAHPLPAPLNKLREFFPNIDKDYVSQVTPPINGETLSQLHDRIASAMDKIIVQCDQEGTKSIIVCSHAAAIIALGRVLTGRMPKSVDEEDFAAFTCGLSTYRRRKGNLTPLSPAT